MKALETDGQQLCSYNTCYLAQEYGQRHVGDSMVIGGGGQCTITVILLATISIAFAITTNMSNSRSSASSVHTATGGDLSIADEIMRNLDFAIAGIDPADYGPHASQTLRNTTLRHSRRIFTGL